MEYCVLHPRSDSRNWPKSSECDQENGRYDLSDTAVKKMTLRVWSVYVSHCQYLFASLWVRLLYPGIYAVGYIAFVFPFICSSVRLFVSSFIRDSVPFVELLQIFTLKFLMWGISHQSLIRNHSYLNHR